VITFVLLCGYTPFGNEKDLFDRITHCSFDFDDNFWNAVSENAKDFIKKLLLLNQDERLTATQALKHDWFINPYLIDLSDTFRRNFKPKQTFKKGII
jgi:serine/threonine protein kinase